MSCIAHGKILFYVGGYFSRSLRNQVDCQSCKNVLVSNTDQSVNVVCEKDPSLSSEENDRRIAFINFPSGFIFTACVLAWDLYNKILENSEASKLLFQPNISAQTIFSSTFLKFLSCGENTQEIFLDFVCELGHPNKSLGTGLPRNFSMLFQRILFLWKILSFIQPKNKIPTKRELPSIWRLRNSKAVQFRKQQMCTILLFEANLSGSIKWYY